MDRTPLPFGDPEGLLGGWVPSERSGASLAHQLSLEDRIGGNGHAGITGHEVSEQTHELHSVDVLETRMDR
eukprot:1319904-Alexandrium_andersonii.AAC.1